MKKILLTLALIMGFVATQAQVTLEGSKFTDNWSLTLKGGAVSPLQHYAFWPSARGMFGAELRKQITPVLGLGVEGEWSINTSSWAKAPAFIGMPHSNTIIDHQLVGGFATLNIMNMLTRYRGVPRTLELEAVLGLGWWHAHSRSWRNYQLCRLSRSELMVHQGWYEHQHQLGRIEGMDRFTQTRCGVVHGQGGKTKHFELQCQLCRRRDAGWTDLSLRQQQRQALYDSSRV